MAITFACPCGKLLKARPEFAGRRTRCTRCQMTLVIPHADQGVGSVSESELLAPMDFGEVDNLIGPGLILPLPEPPEPPPLENPAAGSAPEILAWLPPAEPASPLTAVPSEPVPSPRPRAPWPDLYLLIIAYSCMAFGVIQLLIVVVAVLTRQAGISPWMILLSVGGLLAAGAAGGLLLLVVEAARRLRAIRDRGPS